jgi:hypothetical protein
VGYKLASLPQHLKAKAAPHLRAASDWLLRHPFPEGGWGYNEAVGSDADSTSFAILFLASAGRPVPETAYQRLALHQSPDGGFSTYLTGGGTGSWGVSHPDVTPIALLAMLTRAAERGSLDKGIEYVLGHRTPVGVWNSFWWDSFLYGTEASLAFLRAVQVETVAPTGLDQIVPAHAFEAALLISSLFYADPRGLPAAPCDLVGRLMAEQEVDGSWKSAPILRITRSNCLEPWTSGDAGPLYPDPRRLFTTSTALHALSRMYARL